MFDTVTLFCFVRFTRNLSFIILTLFSSEFCEFSIYILPDSPYFEVCSPAVTFVYVTDVYLILSFNLSSTLPRLLFWLDSFIHIVFSFCFCSLLYFVFLFVFHYLSSQFDPFCVPLCISISVSFSIFIFYIPFVFLFMFYFLNFILNTF